MGMVSVHVGRVGAHAGIYCDCNRRSVIRNHETKHGIHTNFFSILRTFDNGPAVHMLLARRKTRMEMGRETYFQEKIIISEQVFAIFQKINQKKKKQSNQPRQTIDEWMGAENNQ